MKTLNEIKEILRKHKKELKEKYKVKSIAILCG
jgi:predicted nucleotidyltransferase